MSRYVQVQGYSGLVRDKETNAIINVDTTAVERAREQKRIARQKRAEQAQLSHKIDSLEQDVNDIKQSLQLILSKLQ